MWGDLRRRAVQSSIAVLLASLLGLQLPAGPVTAHATAFDPNAAEQQLFGLINQDRAQNGLGPLVANPTMFNIARGAPHQVCGNGQTYNGRAQDMIERQYFSHQIPPCNQYVWPILQSYGVQDSSAGENIAWNTYAPQETSVASANTAFMNSPGHRANILGNYNQVGVGAWAATGPWSDGSGGPWNGVIMYVEIFVNGPLPPPAAPTNVTATPADGSATVAWTPSAPNSFGISSYTVTPYTNGGATAGTPITYGPGSTTVSVPGLSNGTSYSFRVTATNNAGTSPPSALSNAVVPSGSYPYTGVSSAQYQLANSNGTTWADVDATNLVLTITPGLNAHAIVTGNADLWTATAGINQDLGINVNGAIVAWKESGGFAGTFSPNAAFVQTADPMTAGATYGVRLQWKTNKPAGGATIMAAAGSGPYSPTRLTLRFFPGSSAIVDRQSTRQYSLAGSNGVRWTTVDATNLSLTINPATSCLAILSANGDLFTSAAGG